MSNQSSGAAETAGARISTAELAAQSAFALAEIDAFVSLGLIAKPDAEGKHDAGDITRVRLLGALKSAGVSFDKLAAAVTERQLSLEFAGALVAEPVGLTGMTVAEACAQEGMTRDGFNRIMLALGFATPVNDAAIREDDLEFLRIFSMARDFDVPDHVILGTLRSYAISIRRLVDASRELVREHVENPLLSRGASYDEMFTSSARTRVILQRMAYRLTHLLQRRLFEQAVYQNMIARFEEALDDDHDAHRRMFSHQAICFVDLSGFTERTEHFGDADAANIGAALVEIAQAQATLHEGHLVKPLGDGAMLNFITVRNAVRCALDIMSTANEIGLPPARAGIASGPVIIQDGDYYGRTVNRASRLLGVAEAGQVLVTADIASAVADSGLRFEELGKIRLKGLTEAVLAYTVVTVAQAAASRTGS